MANKEYLIIKKLATIFNNQQKILNKLAQSVEDIDYSQYLKEAAQEAGANIGAIITNVNIERHIGKSITDTDFKNAIEMPITYSINIFGLPKDNRVKQKYLNTFKAQIASQKPELVNNLTIFFND